MFAKLKKKIEEQGGNVADGEKFNSNANASTPLKGNYICNYMCNYICNFHIHFFSFYGVCFLQPCGLVMTIKI